MAIFGIAKQLPRTEIFLYDDWPEAQGAQVEFRLIYRGPLHAESVSNSRPTEKHSIRKQFHCQLTELWQQIPLLQRAKTEPVIEREIDGRKVYFNGGNDPSAKTLIERIGDNFQRNGYRFVPLVRR